MLIATANGIGSAYFPIYAAGDMGAGNSLYGVMVTVGSTLEIPFLFLADRIIRRLGMRKTVFILGILTAVRWGNAYFAMSAGQLFITQGFNFVNILEGVTVAILISRLVAPENKTGVQTLSASIQGVVGILISTFGGGVLADFFGIRPLFLIAAAIALLAGFLAWGVPSLLKAGAREDEQDTFAVQGFDSQGASNRITEEPPQAVSA